MKSLLFSILFSIIGMLLWQYEIHSIHFGEGLYWLDRNLISPYLITFFPVISFLFPFILKKKFRFIKIIVAVIILYGISIFCYVAGKELSYMIYCRLCGWTTTHLILFLIFGILIFIIFGFGYWLTTCKLLQPIKKSCIVLISAIALCVIPLSLVTSKMFPLFNQTDWINTVKSGFPVFWITFLLGIAGIRLVNQKI
ncbi:MAG: hypothetical protein ABI793_02700 [Flavobacterium sp.]